MDQIKILSRWNSKRILFECVPPNGLSSGVHVRHAVEMAVMRGADLGSADLGSANLHGANLHGANLRGANLGSANLRDANLRDANLRDANLRGANLRSADLRDADLGSADLGSADLGSADLHGANLHGANLRGANLGSANLRDANLRDANLRGANLRGANLRSADLGSADLGSADLGSADLRGANLGDANLRGANLGSADLDSADLDSADLRGAKNLSTTKGLDSFKLDFWDVLLRAPAEISGLRAALIEGRINGSVYIGDCACLVGTIGNVRGVHYSRLGNGLSPNPCRPAEIWFTGIYPGEKPETNEKSRLAVMWLDELALLLMAAKVSPPESDGQQKNKE